MTSGVEQSTPAVRAPAAAIGTAVVLATGPYIEAAPTPALLPFGEGTVAGRVVGQLNQLGLTRVHVLTRPEWQAEMAAALPEADVEASPDLATDLRAIARVAGQSPGGLVLTRADLAAHTQAFEALLADPRIRTGVLVGQGRTGSAFDLRTRDGLVVSAASPFHHTEDANTTFLSVLKVASADVPVLADVAEELAGLAAAPPSGWRRELKRKRDADRLLGLRQDVSALLVVGLVRREVVVQTAQVRKVVWRRVRGLESLEEAVDTLGRVNADDRVLDAAVKSVDGFFTTFFVSTWTRYAARAAARRGLTPNQITTASVLLGVAAAALFATGERWGFVAGAVVVYLAFATDCVDGQLARYTRQFSKFGGWLDAMFDRAKEYVVFAGLAIGSARHGQDVWQLAGAALTLQTVRHSADFSYHQRRRETLKPIVQPGLDKALDHRAQTRLGKAPAPVGPYARAIRAWRSLEGVPGWMWVKRMFAFPIGERFAVIALCTALWTPHTTFVVLLSWSAFAGIYTQSGRVLSGLRQ